VRLEDEAQATTARRHRRQVVTVETLVRHLKAAERRLIRMKTVEPISMEGVTGELESLLITARAAIGRMVEHAMDIFDH
jgi:division protein CdvB (Snf7/Vps24/ESCRT-III family)